MNGQDNRSIEQERLAHDKHKDHRGYILAISGLAVTLFVSLTGNLTNGLGYLMSKNAIRSEFVEALRDAHDQSKICYGSLRIHFEVAKKVSELLEQCHRTPRHIQDNSAPMLSKKPKKLSEPMPSISDPLCDSLLNLEYELNFRNANFRTIIDYRDLDTCQRVLSTCQSNLYDLTR